LDEGTGQTSEEKITELRKRVVDALREIMSAPRVSDASDRAQLEAHVYGFLGACTNLASAQQTLFLEELSYGTEIITALDKMSEDEFSHRELAKGIIFENRRLYAHLAMDSLLTFTLMNLATLLVKSATDFESMRNTMAAYSEVMGKFKKLIENKATGKDVETWFNTIWDRQVKRGVIR
jgi:hypothetical protein